MADAGGVPYPDGPVSGKDGPALMSAAGCLMFLCRERGLRANRAELLDRLRKEEPIDLEGVLRCARAVDLPLRPGPASAEALRHPAAPALVQGGNGRFALVAAVDDDNVWLIDPRSGNGRSVPKGGFLAGCSPLAAFSPDRVTDDDEGFSLRSVASHLLRHKAVFGPLVAASFLVSLLGFVYPLVFLIVIDKVVANGGAATLDVLVGGLLFFLAFEALLRAARHRVLRHAVRGMDRSLLARLVRHSLELPTSFHQRSTAVDTLARVEDLRHLRKFLTDAVVFVFVDILFVFAFLALMLNFSPALSLIVLASLPLYIAPAFVVIPALRRRRRRLRGTRRDSNEAVLDTFNGIATIKGMRAEHAQEAFLTRRIDEAMSSEEDSQDLRASMTQYNQFVNRAAIAGLLWFGASMVLDGELTLGQLVAINILNMRFSQPMMRLCLFVYDFSQLRTIVREIGKVLEQPGERRSGPAIRPAALEGRIRFENVRFRYPGADRDALDGITLDIAPGETVAVVGSSGSGKSTFARLVQKLHRPTDGRVTIDGVDAAMLEAGWLRGHIGVVEQDYPIFRRTVAENIALGPAERQMERVVQAATAACAHDFIAALPDGYETGIGGRHVHLSGGERQRVALARAFFHADGILILDEATSSLDHETERRLQENLRTLSRNWTVIIIAHRLPALRLADRVVSLDRGRIVEQGTPAELALRDGYFSSMVLDEPVLADGFVTGPVADDSTALARAGGG